MAIAPQLSPAVTPGQFCCLPKQRFLLAPGWNTLVEVSGQSGLLTNFWMADYELSQSLNSDLILMRVSFDGESVPSLFGPQGGSIRHFYPQGPGQNVVYATKRMGISKDDGTTQFSGFLRHVMPFATGFKVELFNPLSGNIWLWAMMEWNSSLAGFDWNPNYRLKARISLDNALAQFAAQPLLDTSVDTMLLGMQHYINGGPPDAKFMEGDYRISYKGRANTYQSSGLEDFYRSSYYFDETQLQKNEDDGVILLNVAQGLFLGYRFFSKAEAPTGPQGLVLTWTNADADYPQNAPNRAVQSEVVVWSYELNGTAGAGGGLQAGSAPTQQVGPPGLALTPQSGALLATFSANNATRMTLERSTDASFAGAVPVYNSAPGSYQDTGLTNGTTYYYRAKGYASGYADSAFATASGAPSATATVTLPDMIQSPGQTEETATSRRRGGNGTLTNATDSTAVFSAAAAIFHVGAGAYFEENFQGTVAQYWGPKSTNQGTFRIEIDGVVKYSGSAYSPTLVNLGVIKEIAGLPNAAHTIRVVNTDAAAALIEDKLGYPTSPTAAAQPYVAGNQVDDDEAGAWDFSNGNWQRSINSTFNSGALHFLAPGAAGVATLVRPITAASVTLASRGGLGDQYDILLNGQLNQTVIVGQADVHTALTVMLPAGSNTLAIRGVAGYNAYATIDFLYFQ